MRLFDDSIMELLLIMAQHTHRVSLTHAAGRLEMATRLYDMLCSYSQLTTCTALHLLGDPQI